MNAIARIAPLESGNFFVVDQILEARSHAPRASVLLRLSDALIAAKCVQLRAACLEVGFRDGAHYLEVRHAAHCATRTQQGELSAPAVDQLEFWRLGMLAIAGAAT